MSHDRLGFAVGYKDIADNVFVPRYYDPAVPERLAQLRASHDLIALGDLLKSGKLHASTGDEIGKMAYGTGEIPFIRTSDISNWEIKADPKQGVSREIYAAYAGKQDVREGDIFFVRDGTYLVGQTCVVTRYDLPCLFQSHILRLRLSEQPSFNRFLFLALLNSPTVKLQIRARQFTADIIDTIGNRYRELLLPVPKDPKWRTDVADETRNVIETRAKLREAIRKIPLWAQAIIESVGDPVPELLGQIEKGEGHPGFLLPYSSVRNSIFVPRYYDHHIDSELRSLAETHQLVPLSDLIKQKVISWNTGFEPGKMAYGTGPVPFIRTSDISNWELKSDPKQSVSEELYEQFREKQDVEAEDIFVVRDGTYLVGTSCILTEHDTKILYCGGIYKLCVKKKDELDPYLLLALLNTPIVRRQMRAKQFTRDIIDTLGKRLFEILLPIPKDPALRQRIANETRETVLTRVRLRNRIREIALEVEGLTSIPEEAKELLETL